jgi:hypothetical protein
MTNCDYVTHMGQKTEKDQSICIGTFRNISKDEWIKMCGLTGQSLTINVNEQNNNIILTPEELRAKRIAFYANK